MPFACNLIILAPFLIIFGCPLLIAQSKYVIVERGRPNSPNYRLFIKKNAIDGGGQFVSPWHDIPLHVMDDGEDNKTSTTCTFNMVVEIPRWSQAKMEMSTRERMSPIRQDLKGGRLRFVQNIYPFVGYPWNYGALPQTWEDPSHSDGNSGGAKGDNDPIDVLEIGSKIHKSGSVVEVKILGVLGLLDEGETDWKLVAIDVTDKMATKLVDIGDVERERPGFLADTRKWLRDYKVPTGKKPNRFAFDGKFQGREFAHRIIEETHGFWKKLIAEENPRLNTESHQPDGKYKANDEEWEEIVRRQPKLGRPEAMPESVEEWHFPRKMPPNVQNGAKNRLDDFFSNFKSK